MRFQAPRGTNDVLPADSHRWQRLEREFRSLTSLYGYREIRTPTFEDTQLFVRSSGETSDIVTKQMYSFTDKGGRDMTLKPEGTAPAMRSVIEHSLCPPGTVQRLCYITPIFRYERPQKGRLREAHQFGLELLGSTSSAADAEIIEVTVRFYERIGIREVEVSLNSLGRDECRARYRDAILKHAAAFLKDQPEDTRAKAEKNPLRLLDSKDEDTQRAMWGAPPVLDFLEEDSRRRFDEVQELLTLAAVPYRIAPEIVRGLDYYTETVFEVQSTRLGAQSALCGGGRYDNLIKELGGSPTPSVGVGMGIERALIVLEEDGILWEGDRPAVFVVQATDDAWHACLDLARDLRRNGVSALTDIEQRKMASQLKQADKGGALFAAMIGTDEIKKGTVVVRELATGHQTEVARSDAVSFVKGRI